MEQVQQADAELRAARLRYAFAQEVTLYPQEAPGHPGEVPGALRQGRLVELARLGLGQHGVEGLQGGDGLADVGAERGPGRWRRPCWRPSGAVRAARAGKAGPGRRWRGRPLTWGTLAAAASGCSGSFGGLIPLRLF